MQAIQRCIPAHSVAPVRMDHREMQKTIDKEYNMCYSNSHGCSGQI